MAGEYFLPCRKGSGAPSFAFSAKGGIAEVSGKGLGVKSICSTPPATSAASTRRFTVERQRALWRDCEDSPPAGGCHNGSRDACELPGRQTETAGTEVKCRQGLFHQAELPNRGRRVRVWLTGFPMGTSANSVAGPFVGQIRTAGFQFLNVAESPQWSAGSFTVRLKADTQAGARGFRKPLQRARGRQNFSTLKACYHCLCGSHRFGNLFLSHFCFAPCSRTRSRP
jgi:hypothetical protein